jgi:hypothetical protein
MAKQFLQEHPLPEHILNIIAETNKNYISKTFPEHKDDNEKLSQLIYFYSFIGEKFFLHVQTTLIDEVTSGRKRQLTVDPIPEFIHDDILTTLKEIMTHYKLDEESLAFKQYYEYLCILAKKLIIVITKRK